MEDMEASAMVAALAAYSLMAVDNWVKFVSSRKVRSCSFNPI